MRTVTSLSLAAGIVMLTQVAGAQVAQTSDRMVITTIGAAPVVIFDHSIPEPPTVGETTLVFDGTATPGTPAIAPPAAVTMVGTKVVFLTEPAGSVPDPGETPITVPGPNGPVVLSDVVLSTAAIAGVPPQVMLVSDGDPNLALIATALPNFPTPPSFLAETGALQDVTSLLGLSGTTQFGPITVQVASDVPEPAALSLLVLAGVPALLRRRR
jgi:hypothetical protein